MSVTTCIVGYHPPNEKWEKMRAVWDACKAADQEVPEDVDAFFGGEAPEDIGVRVWLEGTEACREYSGQDEEGYEIDLAKLPEHITHIRVVRSW